MWYLKKKNDTNELIYKTETDSQTYRTNLQLLGGWREGIVKGVWDGHIYMAIFKMDRQQGLTVWHIELCSM